MDQSAKRTGPGGAYRRLCRQLAELGWISQGSAIRRSYHRSAGGETKAYGPYYSWTRKVEGKTVTVALSAQQYRMLIRSIANHRRLEGLLTQLRRMTERSILSTSLGVSRRRRPSRPG